MLPINVILVYGLNLLLLLLLVQPKCSGKGCLHDCRSRLMELPGAIVNHTTSLDSENSALLYHSCRILLCLIAPMAPVLAEEFWALLHRYSNGKQRQAVRFEDEPKSRLFLGENSTRSALSVSTIYLRHPFTQRRVSGR